MRILGRVLVVLCLSVAPSAIAQTGWQTPGNFTALERQTNGAVIVAQHGRLQVTALSPSVVRVRYSLQANFPDRQSFAVLPSAFRGKTTDVHIENQPDAVSFHTGEVIVRVFKSPVRVAFMRTDGQLISQDLPGLPPSFHGAEFKVWKSMPEDEHYFGLGDKTGPMDHRGMAFTMWNTDIFGWQESTDPLYKDIPFIFAFRNSASYGLFLDNTYRSSFDFGKERDDAYSFGSEGGELDYYFIYGPEPKRVVEQFTELVGRTPLPPLFALGYQQCRYSYYPESQVREIASEFRKRKIPADVIYLDIDYQDQNRPFTVDPQRFPNFPGLAKDLRAEGFKLVTITDLHIAKVPGSKPYDEGVKGGYFVKNPDGSVYVGKVWPGDSVFPDFTRKEVRQWWGTLYADFLKDGVRGFWNDMNEPAVFRYPSKTMPLETVHNIEGRETDHREVHNVFGMENARATHDGLLQLQPDQRPFVLTRAAYAGTQRYAATWTGDNSATWNHMRLSVPQLINLGLSGYAFVGDDIGGFNGSPTPELLTRWMELGVFNPIYRNHAAKETRFREPWVDGPEHEAIRKRYIETRYQILPYIYTAMEETSRTGVPLMRPLFMEFPEEPLLALNDSEFMFGDSLLVAPKMWPFLDPYTVALPKGSWYDFWTGARIDGDALKITPALDTLPVYIRAGSIIPEQAVVQNTDETPQGPLVLNVYPGPDCHGSIYADDGNTFAYQRGETFRASFTCEAAADHIDVSISAPSGLYKPWFSEVQTKVVGVSDRISSVRVDSQDTGGWALNSGTLALPAIKWSGAAHKIVITFASHS